MKRWISALLACIMVFALVPSALAADHEMDYDESLSLDFSFTLTKKDGSAPKRGDVDITVRGSSFLDAYERNVSLSDNTLSMEVVVTPEGDEGIRQRTGSVKVSVKVPSSYNKVSAQSQSVTVNYPQMDLEYFEDTLYDMRDYDETEEFYSPETLVIPSKAITLMKKYMKSDYVMNLEYDDFTFVFTGKNLKTTTARSINAALEDEASTGLRNLLSANGIKTSKVDVLNFVSNASLGGEVGIKVHTGYKNNYVYQYNRSTGKLVALDSETDRYEVTFYVDQLGEFVISSSKLDPSALISADKVEQVESSTSGKKLVLAGSIKKENATSDSGKLIISSDAKEDEDTSSSNKIFLVGTLKEETEPVVKGRLVLKAE